MNAMPKALPRSQQRQRRRLRPPLLEFLASADRRTKDVRIHAVIVAELELRDVQRQIFLADLVEGADHAALDDRPEAFNGVGVDRADNVMPARMVNDAMRKSEVKPIVAFVIVRA